MLSAAAGLPGVRGAEGAAAGQDDAGGSCGRRQRGHRAWGAWEQKLLPVPGPLTDGRPAGSEEGGR